MFGLGGSLAALGGGAGELVEAGVEVDTWGVGSALDYTQFPAYALARARDRSNAAPGPPGLLRLRLMARHASLVALVARSTHSTAFLHTYTR